MTAAVIAAGLGKRYRDHWALRDCSLEIPEGRVAALVGPNGAGKTTLLHMLTGLLRPTAGQVSVLGRTPGEDPGLLPLLLAATALLPPQQQQAALEDRAPVARRVAATAQLAAQEYRAGVVDGRVVARAEVEEARLFLQDFPTTGSSAG